MRSIQTQATVPLSSVKPLTQLADYRDYCLQATRQALAGARKPRRVSPVDGSPLNPAGDIAGLPYGRCPSSGSLFLGELPDSVRWARLLKDVSRYRRSPVAFHAGLAKARTHTVYAPKLEWIGDTLRLQGIRRPRILEVVTGTSRLTPLLRQSGLFSAVVTVDEMGLAHAAEARGVRGRRARGEHQELGGTVQAAVLLESLDRVDDPAALLRAVAGRLTAGGLIFVTALAASGFDVAVLGLRNRYLYPPDRANCFSLQGLSTMLAQAGFALLEVSTPGVLDLEIVKAHLHDDPSIPLSGFERRLLEAGAETQQAFQAFLQERGMSSFARIVGRTS